MEGEKGRIMETRGLKDICWLAGWLEGEGCFSLAKQSNRGGATIPLIGANSTDKDTTKHAAKIMGTKVYGPYKRSTKPVYTIHVSGRLAVEWMLTLYCLMGNRRQARIKEVISAWKQDPRQGCGSGKHSWNSRKGLNYDGSAMVQ